MKSSELKKRKAAWAGQFYPGQPDVLENQIQEYFDLAPFLQLNGDILGLIAPHAGYKYSGKTAAAAYKQLVHSLFKTVIVLAPSHSELFPGASVYNGDRYETPLGDVVVNKALAESIASYTSSITLSSQGHNYIRGDHPEHALEVQLPFLQMALKKDLQIVPIVFHDYRLENCKILAEAITNASDGEPILIVASSDLYHGYSYEDCQEMDSRTIAAIEELNGEQFCQNARKGYLQACGAGPIATMLMVCAERGATNALVVDRTNSADTSGISEGWTVGYASILIIKSV